MATIITRETGATAKGSPLTNVELDNNFINLNTQANATDARTIGLTSTTLSDGSYTKKLSDLLVTKESAINAEALHRSPNAVTAMFVYDTSKDSDGGAWTERCQHTSWYNEAINGSWLGSQVRELDARLAKATWGTELLQGVGTTWDTSKWSILDGAGVSTNNGRLRITTGTANTWTQGITQNLTNLVVGKTYALQAKVYSGSARGRIVISAPYTAGYTTDMQYVVFTATATTITVSIYCDSNTSGSIIDFDAISLRELISVDTKSGDYFQLTTDGKFYKLNATSGTTEVFRGNKADFPRLSAIVAEGSSQSNERQNIVIYDLTEPGHPMWMSFYGDVYNTKFISGGIVTCISAINGVLASGNNYGSPYYGGFRVANFAGDWMHRWSGLYGNNGRSIVGIGYRNSNSVGFPFAGGDRGTTVPYPGGDVASGQINAIAMTVLPDAPVDPVTGLQVPTIAVATGGGLSVIKHDGAVVSKNWAPANIFDVAISDAFVYTSGGSADSYWGSMAWNYMTGTSYQLGGSAASIPAIDWGGGGSKKKVIKKRGDLAWTVNSANGRIVFNKDSLTAGVSKGISAFATNTYNTGHQVGDIRRTYLSDIEAGSVSGPELVTNGTFVGNSTAGWSPYSAATSLSGVSDTLKQEVVSGSSAGTVTSAITLVVGRKYELSYAVVELSAGVSSAKAYIGTAAGNAALGVIGTSFSAPGTARAVFTALASTYYITIEHLGAVGTFSRFDNISLKELVADRSYKAQGASITGTLTKSPVATGSQLVAYSGFSSSNYIRENWSADLDFGTGEWSASAWVNLSDQVNLSSLPVVGNNLVTNGDFSTNDMTGWTVGANLSPTVLNRRCTLTVTAPGSATANRAYQRVTHNNSGYLIKITVTVYEIDSGTTVRLDTSNNLFNNHDLSTVISSPGTYEIVRPTQSNTCDIGIFISGPSGSRVTWGLMTTKVIGDVTFAERSAPSGAKIFIGMRPGLAWGSSVCLGNITATVFDGTNPARTVITNASYSPATWLKVRANYTTDGSLALLVNGVEVAVTRGAPLLTLNNSNAVLTIGNSYNLDAPFPGSLALLKLSATVPTAEQSLWMYEQEKQMFRENAQVCLPDANAIVDLAYDEMTDSWIAASSTNTSYWTGLVRTAVTPVPSGSYSKLAVNNGMLLSARSGSVDLTAPEKSFVKNLNKSTEISAKNDKPITIFDYLGGFTANTTSLTNSATSVTSLSYPVSYVNTLVSSSALPTDTTIKSVNGTTVYFDKTATGSITAAQISFRDFILPVGYEARAVLVEGVVKREGSTADYTRLFDGFKETIRFAVAPGYNAKVQIQAVRSAI